MAAAEQRQGVLFVPVVDHVRYEEEIYFRRQWLFEEVGSEEADPVVGSVVAEGARFR